MNALRLLAASFGVILLGAATPTVRADSVPCGYLHADTYRPVVSGCGDWLVARYPTRPAFKDGRWVISDDGQEFTLMYNSGTTEWASKDIAVLWAHDHDVEIRFGAAQPMDGSEPTQEYLDHHLGLYVESEYVGDWVQAGLPRVH